MSLSRRGLFGILAGALAPAIIRTPGLLMPIRPAPDVAVGVPKLIVPAAPGITVPAGSGYQAGDLITVSWGRGRPTSTFRVTASTAGTQFWCQS